MRPRNEAARERLTTVLARRAGVGATELAQQVGVSLATLHRALKEIPAQLVQTGKARRTRYALGRALRGDAAPVPVYEVDGTGRAELLTHLRLVHPHGSCMALMNTGWPLNDAARDGWWEGLPYPLYDMRPQGYMGRQLARGMHRALAVSAHPQEWSDDDIVHVLAHAGWDMCGSLIVGNAAHEQWQAAKLAAPEPLKARTLARNYVALAELAVAAGVPGSSAGGEFPKFTAWRETAGGQTPHVLVKFSGADDSAAVRRWADLLVCEHLALECAVRLPGIASASSRILTSQGRTFLEVERFDRHGLFGRSRLVSLATLDAALLGSGTTDWSRLADQLAGAGWFSGAGAQRIHTLWWYGRLIANTDMHTGNLSFRPQQTLELAPTYDMVPMLYAPLPGGEVPGRNFEPPLPLPTQRQPWLSACEAALAFWTRAASDARVSEAFRRLAATNGQRLQAVAQHA